MAESRLADPTVVVTVNRNNIDGLAETLSSVFKQEETASSLIIDSSDEHEKVAAMVKTNFPKANLVFQSANGVYPAMNLGLDILTGEQSVIFLNSGDRFSSCKSLGALKRGLESGFLWSSGLVQLRHPSSKVSKVVGVSNQSKKCLKYGCAIIPQPATLLAPEIRNLGIRFNSSLSIAADTDFHYKIYKEVGFPYLVNEIITDHSFDGISAKDTLKLRLEIFKVRATNFPIQTLLSSVFHKHDT